MSAINSELRAEVSRLHSKADDYEKANALLDIADKAQVDYKTILHYIFSIIAHRDIPQRYGHGIPHIAFVQSVQGCPTAAIDVV